jgi:hypothetical protein
MNDRKEELKRVRKLSKNKKIQVVCQFDPEVYERMLSVAAAYKTTLNRLLVGLGEAELREFENVGEQQTT